MFPRAKKSYGQNFLVDQTVVEKIIAAAEIKKGETILEIGSGTGVLTEALLRAGAHVIAIESDHDLIAPLQEKFGNHIELIEGDVLNTNLPNGKFKIVANIPYNITSHILEKFLAHKPKPSHMVLMLQKEVADRILAKPPQMSLLSVMCQLYATCTRVTNVKAGAFRPIPNVDSAVVKFELRNFSLLQGEGKGGVSEGVVKLAKAGFSSRRKQLHHNLSSFFAKSHSSISIKSLLVTIGLDPKVRAENLTVEDWIRLYHLTT